MDSYVLFLREFGISPEALVAFGLRETIFADDDLVRAEWERQKGGFLSGETQTIRDAGRNGTATSLYAAFYGKLLNLSIVADPTNNALPRRVLKRTTRNSGALVNYQVAHVFGRTKNPLLFTAPWNIVWKPKILDPFTGHEAKGEIADGYRGSFRRHVQERLVGFLEDYERFRCAHFCLERVELVLEQMRVERIFLSERQELGFQQSVRWELGRLI